jgi:hypothetical protein
MFIYFIIEKQNVLFLCGNHRITKSFDVKIRCDKQAAATTMFSCRSKSSYSFLPDNNILQLISSGGNPIK